MAARDTRHKSEKNFILQGKHEVPRIMANIPSVEEEEKNAFSINRLAQIGARDAGFKFQFQLAEGGTLLAFTRLENCHCEISPRPVECENPFEPAHNKQRDRKTNRLGGEA